MKEKNKKRDASLLRRKSPAESVGVFDIGSNSVRFVAYDLSFYPPLPFFNGKVTCGLGRDLEKNGKLSGKGMKRTMKALKGFMMLAEALNIGTMRAIATAAIRDAEDGPAFAKKLSSAFGLKIEILSGDEEALYSARGVMGAFPGAKGIIADLGGGSLELARIGNGNVSEATSFPLGVLRLVAHGGKAKNIIAGQLGQIGKTHGNPGTLYAIGGTWRAFAEARQTGEGVVLPHSHGYEMDADDAIGFARKIADKKEKHLVENYAVEKKRAELLPYAGLIMECLLENTKAKKVVFSNAGLRDGIIYSLLNDKKD